jgi:hypothetical protein
MKQKSEKQPLAPQARKASPSKSATASSVLGLFTPSSRPSASARVHATMNLDEIPDDKCAWCASPFEAKQRTHAYCCRKCQKAASRDELEGWRARVREVLKCQDCGTQIQNAVYRNTKYCPECRAKRIKLNAKNSEARAKAGTTGRRGSNQYGRKGDQLEQQVLAEGFRRMPADRAISGQVAVYDEDLGSEASVIADQAMQKNASALELAEAPWTSFC